MKADLVIRDARIRVPEGRADAVAISGDRILAVGEWSSIREFVGKETDQVPAHGRSVLPGFIDSHTHFLRGGLELSRLDLGDVTQLDTLAQRIASHAASRPGQWVLGGSWDEQRWGGWLPDGRWLDPLVPPGTPVFLARRDLHMALASTEALERAGITKDTTDPPGGVIDRDETGAPTGILRDQAMRLVESVVPPPDSGARQAAVDRAAALAFSLGVTCVNDMCTWEDFEFYRRIPEGSRIPRVYAVAPLKRCRDLNELLEAGHRGHERVWWGGVKAFVDGSLGSRTAWFHEPYQDDPSTSGIAVSDLEELKVDLEWSLAAGLQLVVHAIGDRANDWILDLYQYLDSTESGPLPHRRCRVEHAQHLSTDAAPRFGKLGVIASVQPYHLYDDGPWMEARIGEERAVRSYPFRDLLDAGARLAFGSDWTVAPLDPIQGMRVALSRGTPQSEKHRVDQSLTMSEALDAYGLGAAFACCREDRFGTLEKGKLADLVILSDDLDGLETEALDDLRVDLTISAGEIVYSRK